MAEVKYQGPVTIHKMIDPVPGPSFEDLANAMPKRDKLIQICQSDEMFTWMHALATILVINEKAVLGGLKVSEQLRVWQDRIRILKKPPWIFAPLNMCRTIDNTSWEEAMTARPEMGTDGLLTIAIGNGPTYRLLPKITSFFGIIAGLFKKRRCTKLLKPMTTSRSWPLPSRRYTIKPAERAVSTIALSSTCRKMDSESEDFV